MTGFMKQTQGNALNIKTAENKFGCTLFAELRARDIYAGTNTNLQIVFNILKSPYLNPRLNQATQKNLGVENFKPKKILRSSPSL